VRSVHVKNDVLGPDHANGLGVTPQWLQLFPTGDHRLRAEDTVRVRRRRKSHGCLRSSC